MAVISILGAGAMGCLWATHLHRHLLNAADFTTPNTLQFISTKPKPPRHIGVSLHSPFLTGRPEDFRLELPVITPSELQVTPSKSESKPIHIILLCTKSYHATEAVVSLKPYLNQHCYLVLFQNGLGSQHAIIEALPDIPLFAAVSTEGVNRQANGILVHAGKGLTRIGPLNDAAMHPNVTESCLKALNFPGLKTQACADIWSALWEKLAINCAINPFTALLDCPNGAIKDTALFQENWPLLKRELSAMLHQAGLNISMQELEACVFQVINNTRTNISSMLQDKRANRKTEIDDINGFAARYLADHGLSNTVNQMLCAKVTHSSII